MLRDYQRELVEKVKEAYKAGHKAPCIVSPCGSGKSVVIAEIIKQTAARKNRTLFLIHRRELAEQIKSTLEWWGVDLHYVEIGMVQTVVRRLRKTEYPQLIITDENHHSLANSYKKIYKHFEDARLIGFTATPIRINGGGLGDVNDLLIEGPSVKWLIENSFLTPYRYFAPKTIDVAKLAKRRGDFVLGDDFGTTKVVYGNAVKHYKKLADGEQAICYCSSIAQSKGVAEEFNAAGIPTVHIDGSTAKEIRDKAISDFRNKEIKILCNVDLIGEGFDVPDCSTVIMLRPTMSLSLYIQQSMRGMRYRPGKTSIIIDHVGNVDRHGLPDKDRVWSLDPKQKGASTSNGDGLRQCLECYSVAKAGSAVCPVCGYEFVVEAEEVEVLETELEELVVKLDFREPEDCKSMADLYELARNRGYKPGWAFFQGKKRGFIK